MDFNAFDFVDRDGDGAPVDTAKQIRRIKRASVHKNLHALRYLTREAMVSHHGTPSCTEPNLQAWHCHEEFAEIAGTTGPDVIAV